MSSTPSRFPVHRYRSRQDRRGRTACRSADARRTFCRRGSRDGRRLGGWRRAADAAAAARRRANSAARGLLGRPDRHLTAILRTARLHRQRRQHDPPARSRALPAAVHRGAHACTAEWMRVLKPSGSLFVNLGDKYMRGAMPNPGRGQRPAAHDPPEPGLATDRPRWDGIPGKSLMLLPERYRVAAVDDLGLIARAVLVWSRPNGLPESVTDRVRRSHEDWVHLVKRPRYYSAVDELREPHTMTPHGGSAAAGRTAHRAPSNPARRGRPLRATGTASTATSSGSSRAGSGTSPPSLSWCPNRSPTAAAAASGSSPGAPPRWTTTRRSR